jgi:hypothetical protein
MKPTSTDLSDGSYDARRSAKQEWKSLSQQPEDAKTTKLIERRESLAREIVDTTKYWADTRPF